MYAIPTDELSPAWIFRICDDAILRSGKLGEREIFVYREGFYRGVCVAFAFMTISLVALMIRVLTAETISLAISETSVVISCGQVFVCAAITGSCCWLSFNRFIRFGEYRVNHAVTGFLTLDDAILKKGEEKKDDKAK